MNARLLVASSLVLWCGATLLLSRLRAFAPDGLTERLRPHVPGATAMPRRTVLSAHSIRDVVAPLVAGLGTRLAKAFGVEEDLATRLRRVHAEVDPMAFRVRQAGWALGAFTIAAGSALALRLPPAVSLLPLLGSPVLGFLVVEQRLAKSSAQWQQRLFLELPVVCEQLGMLLSAGHSLGSALHHVAVRGRGACAADLRRASSRVRHGMGDAEALREWAEVAAVPEVQQVVHLLLLDRATADLGQLLSREARSIRQEVQRRRVALLDRRAQQVWIPVTVATLVPGVIFLAVPFVQALQLFSSS